MRWFRTVAGRLSLTNSVPPSIALRALGGGCDLVLGVYTAWRRDLDCVDALLLLAITRSNVDGILYSRELRARYGGPSPIAPDDLRQPVSPDIVAHSLGLQPASTRRRLARLAERNECVFTPSGLLITEDQIEATHRLQIVELVYDLLSKSYAELREQGLFERLPLPPFDPAEGAAASIRPAGAHAAKYVLRLLATLGRQVGDLVDGLIWLQLWRNERHGGAPTAREAAAALGMPYRSFLHRTNRLESEGLCERRPGGAVGSISNPEWLGHVADANVAHLFQLFAGLAEVGALADFERGAGDRRI